MPTLRGLCAALALLCAAHGATAQAPPLAVCVAADNEPLSYVHEGKPRGFDVRIAQAIADELGRPLKVVPFETEYERESTLAREVNALLSSQVCELASGFPLLREDLGVIPGKSSRTPDYPGAKRFRERPFVPLQPLEGSRGYQGMAFVAIMRKEVARPVLKLSDLSGLRIANTAGTLSGALLMMYRNGMLKRDLVSLAQRGDTAFELIEAGKIDAALVPASLYDAWKQDHASSAVVLTDYRRPLGVNLGFVAAPQGADALRAANRVIERGELAQWAASEHVSWMRPTQPDVSRTPALHELAADP